MCHIKSIKLENLSLKIFDKSFIGEKYLSWLEDPETVRFLEIRFKKFDLQDLYDYYNSIDWKSRYFFALVDTVDNTHIGNATLYNVNSHHLTFDLGLIIGDKKYWGGHYSEYSVALLLYYAFEILKMRRFFGGAISRNFKTIFLLKKMGFELSHIKKEAYIFEGELVSQIVYTIDEIKWKEISKKYKIKEEK